jgi:ribose-phosphate pyrophosphokinase
MYALRRPILRAAFAACTLPTAACAYCDDEPEPLVVGGQITFDALKKRRKKNRIDNIMLIAGSGHPKLSAEISQLLNVPLAEASIARFADGEVNIKIHTEVRGKDVFYIQPCSAPSSDNVMELLLFISACRRSGAKRVTAVIPVGTRDAIAISALLCFDACLCCRHTRIYICLTLLFFLFFCHQYFPFKHRRLGTMSSTKFNSRFLSSSAMDFAIMMQEMGVDRVIAVDLQRPGQGQEACFFDNSIPLEVILTTNMMITHFKKAADRLFHNDRPIVVAAPNRECLKKALKFSMGLKKGLRRDHIGLLGFTHQGTGNKNSKDNKLDALGDADVRVLILY